MNLTEIAAALKAKYRPVFRGGVDKELRAYKVMQKDMRETAEEITGAGRAISALTEGKGE